MWEPEGSIYVFLFDVFNIDIMLIQLKSVYNIKYILLAE